MSLKKTNNTYDIIIIGGGIAGIYTAYQITKQFKNTNFLVIEGSNRFGGRVHTINQLEAGAGRFSHNHKFLMELIDELGLKNKLNAVTAKAEYFPTHKSTTPTTESTSLFSKLLEWYLKKTPNHLTELIAKVVVSSKIEKREYLQSVSFTQYAKTILNSEEIKYVHDAFGYYSELVIMNAYDAIQLIENLDPRNKFYVLKGGLSQVIDKMMEYIQKKTHTNPFIKNQSVVDIQIQEDNIAPTYIVKCNKNQTYHANKVICALPKQVIETIPIFQTKSILTNLHKIKCAPLCRIYSKFAPSCINDVNKKFKKNEVWFKNLPKFTTNNYLRMVIPISVENGTIMISYTDNKFADYWYHLYSKKGIAAVNSKIAELIKESTDIDIPEPLETFVYYWPCGVGYWGVCADSHKISQKMMKPFIKEEIYVCGEHYSERNQQWMEGALETSKTVLDMMITK
jgi:monoamine oxidase